MGLFGPLGLAGVSTHLDCQGVVESSAELLETRIRVDLELVALVMEGALEQLEHQLSHLRKLVSFNSRLDAVVFVVQLLENVIARPRDVPPDIGFGRLSCDLSADLPDQVAVCGHASPLSDWCGITM